MGKLQFAGRVRGVMRALAPVGLNISQFDFADFQPLHQDGFTARCHRDWPNDPLFFMQWNGLLAKNPWATVFRSPAWQSAVVDEFVPRGLFRVITVYRRAQLLAILPLALNTASMLETPGKWVTDYLDPLVDAAQAEQCWPIILQTLDGLWDWSVGGVVLHNIRGDSALRAILPGIAPMWKFHYHEEIVEKAPFVALPDTWEKYLGTLSSNERQQTKKKIRHAQNKGKCRLVTLTDETQVAKALDLALHAMCQASSSRKADFTAEILSGFLRRVCPQLARQGDFYIYELHIHDCPAAWLLALRSDSGPMIYNTGYDYWQRQWSPGVVSFGLAIKDAIANKSQVFNFLRGGEEYKRRMGGTDLDLFRVTLKRGR